MTKQEALNNLIALAVCSDKYLHCDEDCPFYKEPISEDDLNTCEVLFEDKIPESVKILKNVKL